MLTSATTIANPQLQTMAFFLAAFGEPPWRLIGGTIEREFAASNLPVASKWIGGQMAAHRNVSVVLPAAGANVWHLAVRAPLGVPLRTRLPATLVVMAEAYWLLWRLNEPIGQGKARELSEALAKEIGGKAVAATKETFPMPGTIRFRQAGGLARNTNVCIVGHQQTAYRIVNGELADDAPGAVVSKFVRADRIEAQPQRWVWENMVPAGEFCVLMGEPGVGKSQIAVDIVARVTSGAAFPGGKPHERGSAIVLETEDDVPTVVIPRLLAAGADMRKVLVHGEPMDLSGGVEMLEEEARRLGDLKLLVLSPLRMFFGETESSRQVDTRARIEPLLRWASARNVAVVGVAHKEAGKKGGSSEDMAGPKAFAQRARAVHSAVIDPNDPEPEVKRKRRLLITAKANNAPDTIRLAYRIQSSGSSSRIVWL